MPFPSAETPQPEGRRPWRWLLLNLLVLPGLGTIMGGRRASGFCQLIVGLLGFACTAGALVKITLDWLDALQNEHAIDLDPSLVWWAGLGLLVFLVSWIWALATSLQLMKQNR